MTAPILIQATPEFVAELGTWSSKPYHVMVAPLPGFPLPGHATHQMYFRTFAPGGTSDGYHTFNELYRHRMLLTAALLYELDNAHDGPSFGIHKSRLHHDGSMYAPSDDAPEGWFIAVAQLPTGQISYHYALKHWDLFKIPERDRAVEWDGHTSEEAAERLENYLRDK